MPFVYLALLYSLCYIKSSLHCIIQFNNTICNSFSYWISIEPCHKISKLHGFLITYYKEALESNNIINGDIYTKFTAGNDDIYSLFYSFNMSLVHNITVLFACSIYLSILGWTFDNNITFIPYKF